MGSTASHDNDNYWPGFVDALSTIIMVITFLLIIMVLIIVILSTAVSRSLLEISDHTGGTSAEISMETASDDSASTSSQQQKATGDGGGQATPLVFKLRPEGWFDIKFDEELMAAQKVDAHDTLRVSSRIPEKEETISLAEEDVPQSEQGVRVTSNSAFISIEFPEQVIAIDEESGKLLGDFVKNNESLADSNLEIRAFASAVGEAISSSRRRAFYRGMAARNRLLAEGIDSQRIKLLIHETGIKEEQNRVHIYVKP